MTKQNTPIEEGVRPRFAKLSDWLAWQESLHVREIELGLERCSSVIGRLGLGKPNYVIFTVGGTNGKGSSVTMLDAMLRAAGYRVGTYTSPHLLHYNERVRIDGKPASDTALCEAFHRVDQARGETSITYFEFGTLAALSIFAESSLDAAVLEVGLGGRLDAVNCLDADVALLAAIDIDHVEWLGPDRETIAREKAGIFRRDRPAVCSDPDVPSSLLIEAGRVGCKLHLLGLDFRYERYPSGLWSWFGPGRAFTDLPAPHLIGDYQYQNASGVIMALLALAHRLPVDESAVRHGLESVDLLGRFTVLPGPVEVILDVAHNPQAAGVLADNLKRRPTRGKTHAIVGMLKDKDRSGVFEALMSSVDFWHVVSLKAPRGAPSEQLANELIGLRTSVPVRQYPDVRTALAGARQMVSEADRILVAGSFLTVSAAMRELS